MWTDRVIADLTATPVFGYGERGPCASEPTALSCLLLAANGRWEAAQTAANWLVDLQNDDGSVGVMREAAWPGWPTSLAVLAWQTLLRAGHSYAEPAQRGLGWILNTKGDTQDRSDELGHDPTLAGWPWVVGTHSWLEPTAFHLLALKATGNGLHMRARTAVRILVDRQLDDGGCNYGNTMVLGNALRAHVQPTGIAMLALIGETVGRPRIDRSLNYLAGQVPGTLTPLSLAWAALGLAAHDRTREDMHLRLEQADDRLRGRADGLHERALLALAAMGERSPLIRMTADWRTNRPTEKLT